MNWLWFLAGLSVGLVISLCLGVTVLWIALSTGDAELQREEGKQP